MTHEVIFNSKSLANYGLILEDADLGTPEAQISLVNVPGRNGALDYTEAIAGYTAYNNRVMRFTLVRDGVIADIEQTKAAIFSDIHGKSVDIYPDWVTGYYHGRAQVSVMDYRTNFMRLAVVVSAEPYRYALTPTTSSLTVGASTVTNGGALPVVPTITTTEETSITYNGATYTVGAGTRKIPGIVLMPGDNVIEVSANASLEYTEGYL